MLNVSSFIILHLFWFTEALTQFLIRPRYSSLWKWLYFTVRHLSNIILFWFTVYMQKVESKNPFSILFPCCKTPIEHIGLLCCIQVIDKYHVMKIFFQLRICTSIPLPGCAILLHLLFTKKEITCFLKCNWNIFVIMIITCHLNI